MSEVSAWGKIWRINGRYLRASCCGWIAWLCWKGHEVGIDWLILFAAVFAAGAAVHGVIAVFQTVKAIGGLARWKRFRKGYAKPKADPIGERSAMRARGMFK